MLTDRVLARLLGMFLDRRLAVGCLPESSALLAERAQRIASVRHRRQVASNWENLLREAHRREARAARGTRRSTLTVRGHAIASVEPVVLELVKRLTTPLPVSARGVAMATELLTDALGPVYNAHSDVSLIAALAAALAQLDPAIPLMPEVSA